MHRLIQLNILLLMITSCGEFDIRDAPQASDDVTPQLEAPHQVYVVTTLADSGSGSLRELVATVPAGSILEFKENLVGKITLTSDSIRIDRELKIIGPGNSAIVVSGNDARRVFYIAENGNVSLQNLIIEHGKGSNGGGILVKSGGSLSLHNTTVRDNQATGDGGGIYLTENSSLSLFRSTISDNTAQYGGGLYASLNSFLTNITSSTFSNNSAARTSGAIFMGSEFFTMTNSTLSKNFAQFEGGGIFISGFGDAEIGFSTITDNTSFDGEGAGVYFLNARLFTFKANLIALNWTTNAQFVPVHGKDIFLSPITRISSLGYNLIGLPGEIYGFQWNGNDRFGNNAVNLSPLAYNGGPTQTCRIETGSRARDIIPITECHFSFPQFKLGFDQRGFARPASNLNMCDIGAYELE